jgi:predicted transcriptional regulator
MHTTVVSVRLDPALLSKLDELCQASAQRRAHMLRWLIASAGLDSLPQAWRDLDAQARQRLVDIR